MSHLYYDYYNSPIGLLELRASKDALLGVELVDSSVEVIKSGTPQDHLSSEARILTQTKRELDEYFAGTRQEFSVVLGYEEGTGTPFMREVWQALRAIPYGETRTYEEIAREVGRPRAARAVGNANNKNPHMVIVPCHRVVGVANPYGYGSGPANKKFLLKLEGVDI